MMEASHTRRKLSIFFKSLGLKSHIYSINSMKSKSICSVVGHIRSPRIYAGPDCASARIFMVSPWQHHSCKNDIKPGIGTWEITYNMVCSAL